MPMRALCLSLCLLLTTPGLTQDLTFAGPFIAFSANMLEPDETLFEPYFVYGRLLGQYDARSRLQKDRNAHYTQIAVTLQQGFLTTVDFELDVSGTFSTDQGTETFHLGDTTFLVGFRFLEEKPGGWTPNFKILIGQLFPTGKFQGLNPTLRGAGITSQGTFVTFPVLALSKTLYLWPDHPSLWTFNLIHGVPMQTRVKGPNVFTGPTPDVSGRVAPGVYSIADLAIEWKINPMFSWTFESVYTYQTKGSFFPSTPGGVDPGIASSDILSLAPGLGIAFSETKTLLITSWFSACGRNNLAFNSGSLYFTFEF